MNKDKIKLNNLVENPERYFKMLKPTSEKRKNSYSLEINVNGYSDLFCLIMDLLKTVTLALEGIEDSKADSEKRITSLLRVIEMLIPIEEADLLDKLHNNFLKENEKDMAS
ncbi:MAG TPA: hypothetical protein VF465_14955 [Flavobacterium sp.]|uniref:hypothetical protein n=1 Tax=Flavobacterium sp. TaxID=239 RepID=UPI002ED381E7